MTGVSCLTPRGSRAVLVALLTGQLIGCSTADLNKTQEILGSAAQQAAQQAARESAIRAPGPGNWPRSQSRGDPTRTRDQNQLRALLGRGSISGAELLTELRTMREVASQQRSQQAMAQFMSLAPGALSPGQTASRANSTEGMLLKLALDALFSLLEQQATTIAFDALDRHLQSMTDDPQLLARERVSLPSPKGLNAAQMQRAVTVAALVVGARATNKMLVKARADFASVENDYERLINRRETAAKVLFDALRSGHASTAGLDGPDTQFLRQGAQKMTVAQFANDMAAQNLALEYLRRTDPTAYQEYRQETDGMLARTKGYLRTTAGVAAFGALMLTFANQMRGAAQQSNATEILTLLPNAMDFAVETPSLLRAATEASADGVTLPFRSASKRFRLYSDGVPIGDLGSASAVFQALQQRGADLLLAEALFRDGSIGLVYKMYQCDRSGAGALLDSATSDSQREDFARRYRIQAVDDFSFAQAFAKPGADRRLAELGDELLARDHRQRTSDTTMALAAVQKQVAASATRWDDDELMRLILANREGVAALSTLQLGTTSVRVVPSAQSIYAYESLLEGCRPEATAATAQPGSERTAPPVASPKPKPDAKPKPKRK